MFKDMPEVGKKPPTSPNRLQWLLGAVAGCLVLLLCMALAGVGWYFTMGPGAAPSPKTGIAVPPGSTPALPSAPIKVSGKVAFSVFTGDTAEGKTVWIMNADGSGVKKILDRASSPAFSPDGTQIAYYHWTDGIYVANADGTNAKKIVGETHARFIAWSHDGKWIAFSSQPTQQGNFNIDAVLVDGSQRRTIVIGGELPSWSPDDSQIAFSSCRGSDCGILIASSLGGDSGRLIVGELGTNPAWSPDGRKIVYQAEADKVKHLFVINADGTGKKQLTSGTAHHVGAQWSPDGYFIFYRSPEGGSWCIWRMNADGTSPVKLVCDVHPVDWAFERLAVSK